ncbi:response regulator transcription factor, partial [Aerococcus mictus]|uniref:response regulator transcription factor n=1 Tax=Aerococcus mictus TaxID=2976810 RepID=UPI000DCC368F
LLLPIAAKSALEAVVAGSQSRVVCVVDDDAAVRDSMRVLLESHGLRVREYASARAFLGDTLNENADCLLLDHHMPEMNGLELLEILRSRKVATAAIVITGRSDNTLRARAIRAGALACLDKPVDEDELFHSIDKAFSQAGH